MGSPGPSAGQILKAPENASVQGIAVLDLNRQWAETKRTSVPRAGFAEQLGDARPTGQVVRPGDILDVSIWEAPPAALFGASGGELRASNTLQTSHQVGLPQMQVGPGGRIFVPFAGSIAVVGRTPEQIQTDIVARLQGKAHIPQALVRIAQNTTANVTVVGEVASSVRMPLTPKGERLLDALAQAGGTRQPINKMTIQVTRGGQVVAMPLSAVIGNPRQNIVLAKDDVITAIYQPFSFTVLGAAGRNEEISFEATGVTLAQALGRIGGIQGERANAKGLFVFRWEDPAAAAVDSAVAVGSPRRDDGKVPVIYRVNLKDPATFFVAQQFEMQNRDIVYVATAPVTEFQQFVGLVASTVLPVVGVVNSVP